MTLLTLNTLLNTKV